MKIFLAAVLALAASHALAGDPKAGEALYGRCLACHSFEYHRTGPKHCGLLGRRAGSAPGYEYSAAMKQSGVVWNERNLDRFLAAPTKVMPGTTMTYAGVPDAQERADLVAYLKQQNASPKCGLQKSQSGSISPAGAPSSAGNRA